MTAFTSMRDVGPRKRYAFLGDAQCEVRYDFEPGCAANYNVERHPHDAVDPKVTLLEVFVNGEWVAASEFRSDWVANVASNLHEEIDAELRERDLL